MTLKFNFSITPFVRLQKYLSKINLERLVVILAILLSLGGTVYAFKTDTIVSYGDAESHLNISKRVFSSLTPGMAQLGGIWLPLPHLFMAPFTYFDWLWRTGLAGSIISGASFIVASLYIYKLAYLVTSNRAAAFFSFLVFAANPNILYMQATPMTELLLIVFFILSSYYFVRHLFDSNDLLSLVMAGVFGLGATLSRYDGWFLVGMEGLLLILVNLKKSWIPISTKGEGLLFLFSTVACVGILLWFGWDFAILSDPLYFTSSQFSAKSQQLGWLAKGQLPSYHNVWLSFLYYFVTSMTNIGLFLFVIFLIALTTYLFDRTQIKRFFVATLLLTPFIFYVITLYVGQSLIFIPHLTPVSFEWRLFNVRYGIMMIPAAAIFIAYLFAKSRSMARLVLIFIFLLQFGLYFVGYSKVMSYEDGTVGLSSSRRPDAEVWLAKNYDTGLVLMDDYSRIFSVIRSHIPMQNIIYVGTKPIWERSLQAPQKYARWVVVQKGDTLWKTFYEKDEGQKYLYTYYRKVYTSQEILIFERLSQYD